jgi:DNA-binding FadR family transcriptional regulator
MKADSLHNNFEFPASQNQIRSQDGLPIGQPIGMSGLDRLRDWMRDTDPQVGSRMPPERALAATLDVSRPELRKALAVLEMEGRIMRHVGRGTFVASPSDVLQSPASISGLAERTGPHDAMMARLSLEPELAHLAALHATPLQISKAQTLAAGIRAATTWEAYERLDHALHDLIAASSGNVLLHELYKIMNAVRQVVVWRQLSSGFEGPLPDYHSFDEHDAIIAAIAGRDRSGARAAMRRHLQSTLNAMTVDD